MGKDILVVGDDEEVLEWVSAALEREGYQVQTSRTGTGFLPVPDHLPDLVLLDVLVHPAVGRAFAQQWKLREPTTAIPLLLFSAHAAASQILPGSHLALFSAHPCHIRALLDAVGTSISSSQARSPASVLSYKGASAARANDDRNRARTGFAARRREGTPGLGGWNGLTSVDEPPKESSP